MQPLQSLHVLCILFKKKKKIPQPNQTQKPKTMSSFTTDADEFTFLALPQDPCASVDVSERKTPVHHKQCFQETFFTLLG